MSTDSVAVMSHRNKRKALVFLSTMFGLSFLFEKDTKLFGSNRWFKREKQTQILFAQQTNVFQVCVRSEQKTRQQLLLLLFRLRNSIVNDVLLSVLGM